MPLAFASIGEENCIKDISAQQNTKQFLENLGFVTGEKVTIVNTLNGNIIVKVKDSRIAISKDMATKIII